MEKVLQKTKEYVEISQDAKEFIESQLSKEFEDNLTKFLTIKGYNRHFEWLLFNDTFMSLFNFIVVIAIGIYITEVEAKVEEGKQDTKIL